MLADNLKIRVLVDPKSGGLPSSPEVVIEGRLALQDLARTPEKAWPAAASNQRVA